MRSYKEIAEETGTTIADVREAMSLAEKREMPVDHYYDDHDSRISLTYSPADYGRYEVIVKTFWAIADKWGRWPRKPRNRANPRGGRHQRP